MPKGYISEESYRKLISNLKPDFFHKCKFSTVQSMLMTVEQEVQKQKLRLDNLHMQRRVLTDFLFEEKEKVSKMIRKNKKIN